MGQVALKKNMDFLATLKIHMKYRKILRQIFAVGITY